MLAGRESIEKTHHFGLADNATASNKGITIHNGTEIAAKTAYFSFH